MPDADATLNAWKRDVYAVIATLGLGFLVIQRNLGSIAAPFKHSFELDVASRQDAKNYAVIPAAEGKK